MSKELGLAPVVYLNEPFYTMSDAEAEFKKLEEEDHVKFAKRNIALSQDAAFLGVVGKTVRKLFPEGFFESMRTLPSYNWEKQKMTEADLVEFLKRVDLDCNSYDCRRIATIAPYRVNLYSTVEVLGKNYDVALQITGKASEKSGIVFLEYFDSELRLKYETVMDAAHEIGHTYGLEHHETWINSKTNEPDGIACIMTEEFQARERFCDSCFSQLQKLL